MNTHIVDLTKYRSTQHPLDLLDPPEIVDIKKMKLNLNMKSVKMTLIQNKTWKTL